MKLCLKMMKIKNKTKQNKKLKSLPSHLNE